MASVPRHSRELLLGEDIGDQAHRLVHVQRHAVGADDAGGLLPAMLQGMKAEVGERGRLRMSVDGDYAAFFAKFVRCSGHVSPHARQP